jgi:hypothetical protein
MSTETYTPIARPSNKRGLALLEETIEDIESHPSTWDQEWWLGRGAGGVLWVEEMPEAVRESGVPVVNCGTTACLFGHIVFKAGGKLCTAENLSGAYSGGFVKLGDEPRSIGEWARELLGLPDDHSSWLSCAERTWGEILAYRDAWRDDEAAGPNSGEAREALVYADEVEW